MRKNRIVCKEDNILWKYHCRGEGGKGQHSLSKSRPSLGISFGGRNDHEVYDDEKFDEGVEASYSTG